MNAVTIIKKMSIMKENDPRLIFVDTLRRAVAYLEYLKACGVEGISVSPASFALSPEPRVGASSQGDGWTGFAPRPQAGHGAPGLEAVRDDLGDCRRCRLHTARTRLVFGVGNPEADLMFIGEGPGEEEDRRGEPFVGAAGAYLTRIIENGMEKKRSDVYITNIVKCRPPGNRDPEPEEIASCRPFLDRQIHAVRPRAIMTLGRPATSTLMDRPVSITKVRGTWSEYLGVKVMATYHPAYILHQNYDRRLRAELWEDVKAVMRELGWPIPEAGG